MKNIYQEAENIFPYVQAMRRDFHQHPELGFKEFRTAGIVARELGQLGIEVSTGIAQTGVMAMVESGKPGPVVMIRVDMDALPITEETGVDYTSQNAGVMHACGHDGHVAIGLGVAKLLHQLRGEWNGAVKIVFQPAEEGDGGAEQMIAAGVLENPKPDCILGIHVWNETPVGSVLVVPGPFMAGADIFSIKITGKGGHGAVPHASVDPIAAAAQVVTALQTIVSRNIAPLDAAVVSVTYFHAGEAFNVIPQVAELRGTIRTFDPKVRQRVVDRFMRIVDLVCLALGCTAEVEIKVTTPAVINDQALAEKITKIVPDAVPGAILNGNFQTMGSEDFAFMIQDIPGCYMMVGSANPGRGLIYGHHHPKFDFDEKALINAVSLMTNAALAILK